MHGQAPSPTQPLCYKNAMARWFAFGPYLVLACGVAIVSTASILIRIAQGEGVPSLPIAALRLTLAALVLTPLVWVRSYAQMRRLGRRELALCLFSGALLAVHFWSWIASLAYTSVASSTALVTTNPLWVGLASTLILRERMGKATAGAILMTLIGSAMIFASDRSSPTAAVHADPTLGNLLALVGAVAASGYLLVGRALRGRVSLLAYIWLAYASAAVLLLIATAVNELALTGYSPVAYAAVLALALGPQLLGHTAFNWALRHLSATFVAVSILGEPVGSAVLALLIFGERFAPLQLAGFALLLAGIFLGARAEARPAAISRSDP